MQNNHSISPAQDIGQYCYLRPREMTASLPSGARILFIGHTPPPDRQWKAGDANNTATRIEEFLSTAPFIKTAEMLGIETSTTKNVVEVDFINLIPIVSRKKDRVGNSKINRGASHYFEDEGRVRRATSLTRFLIDHWDYDVVLIGCGRPKPSEAPHLNALLVMLTDAAVARSIVIMARKPDDDPAGDSYAAHPLEDFSRGTPAVPLAEFMTMRAVR